MSNLVLMNETQTKKLTVKQMRSRPGRGAVVEIWIGDTWVGSGTVVYVNGSWFGIVHPGERGVWEYPAEQVHIGRTVIAL